jgi:hypothetical protein
MKAMIREGENIYHSHMHMYQNILNSSISIFSRNEKKVLNTNAQFMAPRGHEGGNFHNLRSKNAKNHAISLLQMQGCPQSNIKQEIKSFCFKNLTKSNNELS